MLPKHLMEAMQCTTHRNIILKSLKHEEDSKFNANIIGVDVELYRSEAQKAVAMYEKRKFFRRKLYYLWEIGLPNSHVSSKDHSETGEDDHASLIRIRAYQGSSKSQNTYFETICTAHKFWAV